MAMQKRRSGIKESAGALLVRHLLLPERDTSQDRAVPAKCALTSEWRRINAITNRRR
jgi:hypothetical protein